MIFNVSNAGGSGKLVHLNISYDPSLAGATITATNGSEVYNVTADSTGETVISGKSLGVWTITEDTYSTSVSVNTTYYGNYSVSVGGDRFITVTYESAFEGTTLTCTNGTDTQTRTASGGSVQFVFVSDGTFTISGTVSGETYTTSVVVSGAGNYSAYLETIPTGSTVTPTDVVQTWLRCAEITDKTYTTISEVLADSTTLLALISNENACDYLVRSTTWASSVVANQTAMTYIGNNNYCANKLLTNDIWASSIGSSTYFEKILNVKVPTMTSNTAPSGRAYGNAITSSTYDYYKAFDKNTSTEWGDGNTNPCYIGYKFGTSVKVGKVYIKIDHPDRLTSFMIKGKRSDDTWEDLKQVSSFTAENNITMALAMGYVDYKIEFTKNTTGNLGIWELQFYGHNV